MKKPLFIWLFSAFMIACSPQIRVYTDRAPGQDPSTYLTYDWRVRADIETGQHPLFYNELNDQRIKLAVNNELNNRGYVQSEEPALLLHYHIVVKEQPFVSIPYDYDYENYEFWFDRHSISSYKEGTLIIDIMEVSTNNLIWRGWAVAVLDEVDTPEKSEELIKKSVSKIMNGFPYCKVEPEFQPITGWSSEKYESP